MSDKEGVSKETNEEDPKTTIFAKFCTGAIKTDPVYEDDYVLVIKDINPQAPIHLLILPKKAPIGKLSESTDDDAVALGHCFVAAGKVSKKLNLGSGYRLVVNQGVDGQQSVNYLHVHLFAGQKCKWPPV
eukprot:gene1609-12734_t